MDQPHGAVPELCVVIPVLNERDNIAPMVARLEEVLAGVDWEVIFVDDDSRDGTREAVRATAAMQPRVRLLHRIGRRGLASAFIEGAQASLATNIAAIDGDCSTTRRCCRRCSRCCARAGRISWWAAAMWRAAAWASSPPHGWG
jgi:glycosyltransferase involved in cell wall biosynthesis